MKYFNESKNWLRIAVMTVAFAATGPMLSFADEVDDQDEVGDSLELRGTIDAIDLAKRTVVINDWVYNLSLALKVHEGNNLATDFALREKLSVVFQIDPETRHLAVQTITDVWLNR